MQPTRKVSFKTQWDLVRHNPLIFVGLGFTVIPGIVLMMFHLIVSSIESDVPKVDYVTISEKGNHGKGIITGIKTDYNTSINGEHPSVISYTYSDDGKNVEGKVRVLDPQKVRPMRRGDEIDIKYIGEQSIIVGLEPFSFPMQLVYSITLPLMLIGLAFICIPLYFVSKRVALYRHGKVIDAEIISLSPRFAFPAGVDVHYRYKTSFGKSVLGNSASSDYSIINHKKSGDTVKIFVSRDENHSCLVNRLDAARNGWDIR